MASEDEWQKLPKENMNDSPANKKVSSVYEDPERSRVPFQGFQILYTFEELFDITLQVEDEEFGAHKAFLAASCDYFKALFKASFAEKDKSVIRLNGISAQSMRVILEYLYYGMASLTTENVQNVLSAADMFQLERLRLGCADYMLKKLDIENCIGMYLFAQAHKCFNLETESWCLITESFQAVSQDQEFLQLNADSLADMLRHNDLQATEKQIFEAAMRWLKHSEKERKASVFQVFQHVRFFLMEDHYFFDHVKNNILFKNVPELLALFDDVVKYKLLRNRVNETDLNMHPRVGHRFCRVVIYSSYLDDGNSQVIKIYSPCEDDIISASCIETTNILTELPSGMENPCLTVSDNTGCAYMMGGEYPGDTVYQWNQDDVLTAINSMNVPRKEFCIVQGDKYIYAIGGCNMDEITLTSVSAFNEQEEKWLPVASLPRAVRLMCGVAFNGKVYVFGGEIERYHKKNVRGKKEISKQCLCYDPECNNWTELTDMETPRALAGCAVYKQKIYVVGGFIAGTDSWFQHKMPEEIVDTVEIFDPSTNSWSPGPNLPVPLCSMGVVKYRSTIYILGGKSREDFSTQVLALSSCGNKWEIKPPLRGDTETSILSSYGVLNVDLPDEDYTT